MPKRGGASGVSVVVQQAPQAPAPPPPPPPQPTLQQRLAQLVQGINSLQDFSSLPYDDKMDLIEAAMNTPVPAGKPNTVFQQLAEYLGFDVTPPQVVTDAQLNAMPGQNLYRTVKDIGGSTAVQIATDTLRKADTPFYSDSGGSVYGRGLYFTTDLDGSVPYGRSASTSRTIRAKLDPNAKVVTRSQLRQDVQKAQAGNNRFARMLNRMSSQADVESVVAAFKGYDAISNSPGMPDNYHTIISRRALVYSSKIKGFDAYGRSTPRWGTTSRGANVNIV